MWRHDLLGRVSNPQSVRLSKSACAVITTVVELRTRLAILKPIRFPRATQSLLPITALLSCTFISLLSLSLFFFLFFTGSHWILDDTYSMNSFLSSKFSKSPWIVLVSLHVCNINVSWSKSTINSFDTFYAIIMKMIINSEMRSIEQRVTRHELNIRWGLIYA